MPPKRALSPGEDTYEDTNEDDQRVKRRKTHPHRGQIMGLIEVLKETLDDVTSKSLAEFNAWERKDKRRGVFGLDVMVLESDLEELVATMDAKAMEDKLNEIDTSLATKQDAFRSYINRAEEGDVRTWVLDGLDPLIKRIELARMQLPGIPSY